MTKAQFPVGTFVNNPESDTAVNAQLTQRISFWSGKVTDGAYSVFRSHREFLLLLEEGTLKLEWGPLLPPRCSTAGVFTMPINQAFRCTCWGTSCRKQVYLGTKRTGDCGECWGLPDVFHINTGPTAGGDRKDIDLIKNYVQIWLLISTHCVNVIHIHAHTICFSEQLSGMCWYKHEIHFSSIPCTLFCSLVHTLFITFPCPFKKIFPGRKLKFQFNCECLQS